MSAAARATSARATGESVENIGIAASSSGVSMPYLPLSRGGENAGAFCGAVRRSVKPPSAGDNDHWAGPIVAQHSRGATASRSLLRHPGFAQALVYPLVGLDAGWTASLCGEVRL